MPQPPAHDTMTLAGLAAANGPWLAARLQRLAEHANAPLPQDVVEGAVHGASLVLAQIMNAEGRPAAQVDEAADPAIALGREQALAHQRAGLSLPASLKVQRLLRRAYDDLVRESWVEKDSRARAHEDVERFFERALTGLVAAWTGYAQAEEQQARLLALREDQLRRALTAAKKFSQAASNARERAEALAGELEQARAQQAQAGGQTHSGGQTQAEPAHDMEARLAQALAEAVRSAAELRTLQQEHAILADEAEAMRAHLAETGSRLAVVRQAEGVENLARLNRALEDLAVATERGEALEEQLALAVHAGQERQARLAGLEEQMDESSRDLANVREKLATLSLERDTLAERSAVLETGGAEFSAQLDRLAQELAETEARRAEQEAEAQARIQELEAEREALAARLAEAGDLAVRLAGDLKTAENEAAEARERAAQAEAQVHERAAENAAERDKLSARLTGELDAAEARINALSEELKESARSLTAARAQAEEAMADASDRSQALDAQQAEREGLAARLTEAEAQASELSKALDRAREELAVAEARRLDAERRASEAQVQGGETVQGDKSRLDELAAARKDAEDLLAAHLEFSPEAVAALDAGGAFTIWNTRFATLFGLTETDLAPGLEAALPLLAARLAQPEAFVDRLREFAASPYLVEDGMPLATLAGETLVFRSAPLKDKAGNAEGGRLLQFRTVPSGQGAKRT